MTYGGEASPEDLRGDTESSQSKVIKHSSCTPYSHQPIAGRVTCGGLPAAERRQVTDRSQSSA